MLRKLAASLACIAWGLWFGGFGALFLFASRLFAEDRPTALRAAPIIFLSFERYQLFLATAALLATVVWRILGAGARVTLLFSLLAVATVPAALGPIFITSRMEQLRQQGQSASPQFMKLHGISMMTYTGQTIILLAAGLSLPWILREETQTDAKPIFDTAA
jgi:Domain of unknown function (DUF4149)